MKIHEWMAFFKDNRRKKLFSLSDLVLLTGDAKASLTVQLSRMVAAGTLKRPVRGWYENPFAPPSAEELAMVIRLPSYLSMEYALSVHGILSQTVHTLTLVTTQLTRVYDANGMVLEYHQVKRPLFWGYEKRSEVLFAEPEKALLDLIYIRVLRGSMDVASLGSLVDDMFLEELDRERLMEYAGRYQMGTGDVLEAVYPA